MSHNNHTPLDVHTFKAAHFSKKKVVADVLFFSLGMLTAFVFVVVFFALVENKTLTFLQ